MDESLLHTQEVHSSSLCAPTPNQQLSSQKSPDCGPVDPLLEHSDAHSGSNCGKSSAGSHAGLDFVGVPITQGYIAIVDRGDLALIAPFSWCAQILKRKGVIKRVCAKAYIPGTADRHGKHAKFITMHRLILGVSADQHVDHRNGNALDNRRSNLRIATPRQNMHNKRAWRPCGFKGITVANATGRYRSRINVNGREVCLGHFDTEERAAHAYDVAALKHFGEFACLNFPDWPGLNSKSGFLPSEDRRRRIGDTTKEILAYLEAQGATIPSSVATALQKSFSSVWNALLRLKDQGRVIRREDKKWELATHTDPDDHTVPSWYPFCRGVCEHWYGYCRRDPSCDD